MPTAKSGKSRAEQKRHAARVWERRAVLLENELKGKIPKTKSPYKVRKYKARLLDFLVECFPGSTGLREFSPDQKNAIAMLQHCIMDGGRIVEAFPRGFAKTAILLRASLWAMLYGYRRMIALYSKSVDASIDLNSGLQTELTGNSILNDLYPKITTPFRALQGSTHRAKYQTFAGKLTRIAMKEGVTRFASIAGEKASGAMFLSVPMSSARGKQQTIEIEGETIILRPDFVAIDDPSDEEISGSTKLTTKLVNTVKKGILRGGGHNRTLAAAMAVTVIEPKDFADRFLADPSWQALRIPMVKQMPSNMELWNQYREIRHGFDPTSPGSQVRARLDALEFYKQNREAMDLGAVATWEWCYEWDDEPQTEISAIQHAMNILLDEGPAVFACECQNAPEEDEETKSSLDREALQTKQHGLERHIVARDAEKLVAFVDLGLGCFWYSVGAFSMGYRGYLIDRATYPAQKGRRLFAKSSLSVRLQDLEAYRQFVDEEGKVPDADPLIYNALRDLLEKILKATYRRESDGAQMQIDRIGVDCAKWQQVVYDVILDLKSDRIVPCHGYGSSKLKPPIAHRKAKKGERKGAGFLYKLADSGNPRQLEVDTNERKTFLTKRLVEPIGSKSTFTFFETDPGNHELMVDHCFAEFSREIETKWGDFSIWLHKHGRPDNDYFDTLVGLMALASFEGCETIGSRAAIAKKNAAPELDLGSWVNG